MASDKLLRISRAIAMAEQSLDGAKRVWKADELDSEERFQEWSATLFVLRLRREQGVPEYFREE
jgi:hypothetical protein